MILPARRESLQEYIPKERVFLTREEREALRAIAPSIAVTPTSGVEDHYDLTPSSTIGAINLGTVAIEIRPKISIRNVLFLMSYALDPKTWTDTAFHFEEEASLVEAIIPGFVRHVRSAFRRGLRQGYRSAEDALPLVRGRIRFDDQVRRWFGAVSPIEVRYDDYTEDTDENRLIKAAFYRLRWLRIREAKMRQAIREFDALLGTVTLVDFDPRRLPEIQYNRLNQHYRAAIELAKLILARSAFELAHGDVRATAFLVDMNEVFEDFLVVALREALKLSERTWPQGTQGRAMWLDEAHAIRLKPDLSWWDASRCIFVGDAKYKRTKVDGVNNPDLYQLLAYTIAAHLPGGLLVYAAGEGESGSHRIINTDKQLDVVALDLSEPPASILADVAAIAERVRTFALKAVGPAASSQIAFTRNPASIPATP